MPKFKEYISLIEDELSSPLRDVPRLETLKHDATAVRNTLELMFGHFIDVLVAVKELCREDGSQRDMLISNIGAHGDLFLKTNKVSLCLLPESASFMPIPKKPESTLARFFPSFGQAEKEEIPVPLPANLGALMQKIEVLHEQKSQLDTFLEAARVERRYTDLASLQAAIDEITQEIDGVKLMCTKR